MSDLVEAVPELLDAAVTAIGGAARQGQQAMATAVAEAVANREHLLVQAGTGTGKSLAYLVPVLAHAVSQGRPVVLSTATLALQAQVVERDLPRLSAAMRDRLGREVTWQTVKGRRNYLCQHKLDGGFPPDEPTLFDAPEPEPAAAGAPSESAGSAAGAPAPTSRLGREILRLREWAANTEEGDRDGLVPGVSERAWRQVSVTPHECLGSRCPLVEDCFVERARARAREVDLVVTNHAFVAIDAFEGGHLLPEHEVLVVDEAHDLADRVTSVISDELTATMLETAARRAQRLGAGGADRLADAGEALSGVLAGLPAGRLARGLPVELAGALAALRDDARQVLSDLKAGGEAGAGGAGAGGGSEGARQVARAAVTEVFDIAERVLASQAGDGPPSDVVWVSRSRRPDGAERIGLHVAPISVADLLREKLFSDRTVVLTSATLELGGSFDAAASSMGLRGERAPRWRGLDVGSPFDYRRQAMLYIAKHLPPPGRDGLSEAALAEIAALVSAAGGRTLGLFSSRRAAEAAAAAMRERLDVPVLCQGDDLTPTLVREFAADEAACLFGTLSLWQGVDVPGRSCQLVIIDRIPFPRPDDPLASARQEAVARSGGNGFMAVAATQAALLLAQGSGRLIRHGDDRGVVAVLDSRLATARYAGFLRASLPPFWPAVDRDVVLAALSRLRGAATPQ